MNERILRPEDLPKRFDDLPLITLINFHLFQSKRWDIEEIKISLKENGIKLCLSRPSCERNSWGGCQSIGKTLSKEEFEKLMENLKTAGWKIEATDDGYTLYL